MTTSEPQPTGGRMWPTPTASLGTSRPAPWKPGVKWWLQSRAARNLAALVEHGTPPETEAPEDDQPLTLFAVDSPASPSPPQAAASPKTTHGGFGQRWRRSFADYNPATSSWRTFQGSLLAEWETYSETWPRAGTTVSGTAYQLPPSAPLTDATESGWWPTPSATLGTHAGLVTPAKAREGGTLVEALSARMWPTPTARLGHRRGPQAKRYFDPARSNDLDDAVAATGTTGQLNPEWVEWLMGYPPGWTGSAD
jgi:hypothetical protein